MGVIYLVSFLLAANGMLVEYNLSQVLSAVLGGTILRYHTSIGIFTFALGIGALIYPSLKKKLSDKNILIISNILVGVIGVLGPLLISSLDPLSSTHQFLLTITCYIPIMLLGISTGLEIPSLFSLVSSYQSKLKKTQIITLCFDYVGMFSVSLLFPVGLLYLGVHKLSIISIVASCLILLILFSLTANDGQQREIKEKKFNLRESSFISLVAFVTSFCSISYELLLAKIFTDLQINEIFAHSITIGIYLLGLSFGALSINRGKLSSIHKLIKAEFFLVVTSAIVFPTIMFVFSFWKIWLNNYISAYSLFFTLQLVVLWIGYWSGKELPLCINLLSEKIKSNQSTTIAINYFGALLSGFIVPLYFLPVLGVSGGLFTVGFLNLLILVLLIFKLRRSSVKFILLFSASLCSLLFLVAPKINKLSEQYYLKSFYHKVIIPDLNLESIVNYTKMMAYIDDVLRIQTPYQYIDVVRDQLPESGSEPGNLTLYLNRQPQFSMDSWRLYHDSFSYGAINLHGSAPKRVLVLGGGDGLLVNLLSEVNQILSIDMVELDQKMIQFSSEHYAISRANNNIFKSKKLNLIIDDAYSWLKKNKTHYDAIFIDFPYPTSFELSRLYSVEFYKEVNKNLKENGFIVMDAPVSFIIDNSNYDGVQKGKILLSTLSEAGFKGLFPFGPIEPFIYAEKRKRNFNFQYDELKFLENRSFLNLLSIKEWFGPSFEEERLVNSIYHPLFLESEL